MLAIDTGRGRCFFLQANIPQYALGDFLRLVPESGWHDLARSLETVRLRGAGWHVPDQATQTRHMSVRT